MVNIIVRKPRLISAQQMFENLLKTSLMLHYFLKFSNKGINF